MEIKNWKDDLKFGKNSEKLTENEKLFKFFPDAEEIIPATLEEDRERGIDRFVIRKGKSISIDVKTRRKGAIDFWRNIDNPDLTLETWSVIDFDTNKKLKIGWTLNDEGWADYILFQFEDIPDFYLYPFQLLKLAFKENKEKWIQKYGMEVNGNKVGWIQFSKNKDTGKKWKSEHIYVPANEVWDAITIMAHNKEEKNNKGGKKKI